MMAIVRVKADNPPDCTGVSETPTSFNRVADMLSVCMGEAETPPDNNRAAGTPLLSQKKHIGLMTTSEKETL